MAEEETEMENGENPVDDLYSAASPPGSTQGQQSAQGRHVEPLEGPRGIDIGTSRIVEYHKEGLKFVKNTQLNAFFAVPDSGFTRRILDQNDIHYKQENGKILVVGDGAQTFANITNGEIGRPMASGILNPKEKHASMIIGSIIDSMVDRPDDLGESLVYSMPGPIRGSASFNSVFHEGILRNQFVSKGYMAKGVNEGYLVILSEMEKDDYSGIGISCGAGLANVCFSYLSVPVIDFSMAKSGDYIDSAAAAAVGEHANRVRVIKEEELNLVADPKTRLERALHIYYEEMIVSLIGHLIDALSESENVPKVSHAIPIVLSGGTALPKGFRENFENILRDSQFPINISEVKMAESPLTTIAKGAYLAACLNKEGEDEGY